MHPEVDIRLAVSSDIPQLMAFDHGYSTDHVWQMAVENGAAGLTVAFREVRLPRPMRVRYPRDPSRLADEWTHKAALLVAERGEERLGYLALVEAPAPGCYWVTDLVVDLRYRRQGVGSRLLQAARAWAAERGSPTLFLEMQHKNYPAICLARKLGMVFAGFSDRYYPNQDIALFFVLERQGRGSDRNG